MIPGSLLKITNTTLLPLSLSNRLMIKLAENIHQPTTPRHMTSTIELSKELINIKSITPNDPGCHEDFNDILSQQVYYHTLNGAVTKIFGQSSPQPAITCFSTLTRYQPETFSYGQAILSPPVFVTIIYTAAVQQT